MWAVAVWLGLVPLRPPPRPLCHVDVRPLNQLFVFFPSGKRLAWPSLGQMTNLKDGKGDEDEELHPVSWNAEMKLLLLIQSCNFFFEPSRFLINMLLQPTCLSRYPSPAGCLDMLCSSAC